MERKAERKDLMAEKILNLYNSRKVHKRTPKQEVTPRSSLVIKTPELSPTKKTNDSSRINNNEKTLMKKKTEKLTKLLSNDLKVNEPPKKNMELVRKVTEKIRMSVTKDPERIKQLQRTPSILRSGIRKSITTKDKQIQTPLVEKRVSRESEQRIRRVTQEFKRTSISLKKTTFVSTQNVLILVLSSGNEKNIVEVEVTTSYSNLSSGIGAILVDDTNKILFVWRGKTIHRIIKSQCADFALKYKAFERPKYKIQIEDEGEESEEFVKAIGGKGGFDQSTVSLKLERLQYENKTITRIPVSSEVLSKKSLIDLHNFYVTTGWNSFLWCGLKTSKNSREAAAKVCGACKNGKLSIFFQSHEPFLFKHLFCDWTEPITQKVPKVAPDSNKKELPPFNVAVLFEEAKYLEKRIPDFNDRGTFKKFRVGNLALSLIKEENNRYILKSEECYVFHYSFPWKNTFHHAVFFWLGRRATILHRGKAAALTVDYIERNKLDAVQVRVLEGTEQREFIEMHKEGIIIKNEQKGRYQLYEIRRERGTDNVRILQIGTECSIECNRNYLIINNNKGIIVRGRNDINIDKVNTILSRSELVTSPCEVETFDSIKGKDGYEAFSHLFIEVIPEFPHAFKLSACTGAIEWESIYELNVQGLEDNRTIAVVLGPKLYFRVKEDVLLNETIKLLRTIIDYTECAEIRNIHLTPKFIRPGEEPEEFKKMFFGNQELKRTKEITENIRDILSQLTRKYPLSELQKKPKLLCSVACGQLETFLEDSVFVQVFGMDREAFSKLPKWKQQNAKIRAKLF